VACGAASLAHLFLSNYPHHVPKKPDYPKQHFSQNRAKQGNVRKSISYKNIKIF
jgi:hypothetical protein